MPNLVEIAPLVHCLRRSQQCIFVILQLSSLEKRRGPSFEQTLNKLEYLYKNFESSCSRKDDFLNMHNVYMIFR